MDRRSNIVLLFLILVIAVLYKFHCSQKGSTYVTYNNLQLQLNMLSLRLKNSLSPCKKTVVVPPVAILFTMYNTDRRIQQTNKVIDFYEDIIPKKCIFLVDSANRGVSVNKVPSSQQAIFDQEYICNSNVEYTSGPTLAELCSLEYALNTLDFGNAKHVMKITTKYCIPRFSCDVLHNIDEDADIIVQSAMVANRQNTEVLGFKLDIAKDILREIRTLSGDLETRMYKLRSSNKYKFQVLPVLELNYEDNLVPRSDGSVLSSLFSRFL